MRWWEGNPDALANLRAEIAAGFPLLRVVEEDGAIWLCGEWEVWGKTALIETYSLRIEISDEYPDKVPQVWEVGGKNPRSTGRHFNPNDGSACLFAPPERWEKWPPGSSLTEFLNGPVKEFFFSQAYFDLTGAWVFGERPHGDAGIVDYYCQKLGIGSLQGVLQCLLLARQARLYRQTRCPCNGRNRAIHCHGPRIDSLRVLLPIEEIDRGIAVVRKAVTSLPQSAAGATR